MLQAVTTVTRALMEEQEANSLREALRNVSGLSYNAARAGVRRQRDVARLLHLGDMYLDGIRDTAQYNREVFDLEQVDVLRGAAAMLFGRGQAGGVIDQVSKTPMLYGINKISAGLVRMAILKPRAEFESASGRDDGAAPQSDESQEGGPRGNPEAGASPKTSAVGVAPSIAFGLGSGSRADAQSFGNEIK